LYDFFGYYSAIVEIFGQYWGILGPFLGHMLEADERGKQANFGKESMHKESDSWKE
jgi:hypothetical protein